MAPAQEDTPAQAEEPETSNARRIAILVACLFELIFFGGTIFGWASLAFVFKQDGVFSSSCPDIIGEKNITRNITTGHNGTGYGECVSQEESLSLVFTVGMAFFGLTSFPVGWIFDRFGLKFTRMFAATTGICGYLLLAFANRTVSWILFPGMACVATSCITMIMTNTYIGRMAGKKSSTIITLYAGSVSSSVVVFLAVKLLHDVGVSRFSVLAVLAGFWVPSVAITYLLLPSQLNGSCGCIANKVSPNKKQQTSTDPSSEASDPKTKEQYYIETIADKDQTKPAKVEKNAPPSGNLIIRYILGDRPVPGVVSDMLSLFYIFYIYWYCALHVRIQFFISQFNTWVTSLVHQDITQVSHFTNVLGYAMMFSIVISPLGGILIDSRRSMIKDMEEGLACRSVIALPSLVITGVCSVTLCLLVYAPNPDLIYVVVIFAEIFRSFFYATGVAILELSFSKAHYGRLFGLARSISGVMSFLQYPYVLWANTSYLGFITVKIFLLVTVVLTMAMPIYIVILYVRHRRKMATQTSVQSHSVRF